MALIRLAKLKVKRPTLIENMKLGRIGCGGRFISAGCAVPVFPSAERLQHPLDLRVNKTPEDIFQFVKLIPGPQLYQAVFNVRIDIEGITARIDDIAGGIGPQINQVPAQKNIRLPIRLP